MTAHQILVFLALICFAISAFFWYAPSPTPNGRGGALVAAGLFFLTLAQLVP
jgi:hypothetical protein